MWPPRWVCDARKTRKLVINETTSVKGTDNHWPLFYRICVLLLLVSVRKAAGLGVKGIVEDLIEEEIKVRGELAGAGLVLLYFETRATISGNPWQVVLNITKLGRTGVSDIFFQLER